MKQAWHPDELAQHWTLSDDDYHLLGEKTGATRLAFAVLLKAFQYEGRFPLRREASIQGSATLCFSRWIQRCWRKLHRIQDHRKHRARLLPEKALRCCRPVRSSEKKVMNGGEALSFTW